MLVVGRAIAGLTSANMTIATAYITDITPEAQRAQRFGLFQAMFGIGFIIGPILGGVLGDLWVRAPFLVAAGLNGLNFLVALFILPESRPGRADAKFDLRSLNPLTSLSWALSVKTLLPLVAVFFILNFVGNMYGTVWALFGTDAFAWNGLMVGLSLGGYGLFHAIVQALLPGPVAKRIGERNAMIVGLTCESIGLLLTAIATQGWVIFAVLPLYAFGGVGTPALQSLTTRQVGPDKQGELQGVLASIVSVASIFGPLFFSAVYFGVRDSWPGIVWAVGAGIYVLAIPLILGIRGRPVAPEPA